MFVSYKKKGSKAFNLGKPRASNPYTRFSIPYLEWASGWDNAKIKWVDHVKCKAVWHQVN